jgi:O-antigen/teichoic acid export membrane protein
MKKKFVTNLLFLLGLNLLIKPFWIFGIDRSVQNAIGADHYGLYYALFNFSFLFNILLDLGITNFNNRNISQNEQLLGKHLSAIIFLRLILAVVYLLLSFLIALFLNYNGSELKMLFVLLFNQMLISFILYLRSNLAGLQLFKTDSFISILDRGIMIAICSILLWTNITKAAFRIEWFIWSQTVAYVITAITAFTILLRKTKLKKLVWSLPFFLMILKNSYPYAILILLMTFSYRIDSVMLERMLPDGALQAGIYAQAYRLLEAAAMLAYLFAGLLLPMYARMLKTGQNVEDLTRLSFSLIIVPAIFAASAGLVYAHPIMNMLYHQHAEESSVILSILMVCFVALSTSYIFGTLLTANGSLRYLNYTACMGMILNVGLNLILIPQYKVLGAAVSCLCTQSATAIVQVIIAKKVFKFNAAFTYLFRFITFVASAITIFWLFSLLSISWVSSLLLSSVVCLMIAFLIRIINLKDLYLLTFKPELQQVPDSDSPIIRKT